MSILVNAPINNLSYGLVSQNILNNLECDYKLKPIGQFDLNEFPNFASKVIRFDEKLDLFSPSLKIFHEHSIFDHIGRGPRIGFPIFEKDLFNQMEIWNIRHQDVVLVCSEWAKSVVYPINNNVHVCPLGVDEDFINASKNFQPQEKVIFYTHGKRETRKGHDILHKLFHKAFQENDNVELWMFTYNYFDSNEETRKFQQEYRALLGNKVKFFPWMPKDEMIKWLSKTSFGIFPFRSEGFCLPLIEAMAMGKKVLGTYYSGPTEYLPKNQSFIPKSFVEAFDGKWFNGGFTWAKIEDCEDEIVEKLRKMYQSYDQTISSSNVSIASKFTWKKTAREVLNGIQRA